MSYLDPAFFLNGLLADLGQEQDAYDGGWAYDRVVAGQWFTANHMDGRLVQVFVEHVSPEACGTSELQMQR